MKNLTDTTGNVLHVVETTDVDPDPTKVFAAHRAARQRQFATSNGGVPVTYTLQD